jgi:thiamine-monophosphate kinase
MRKSVEKNAKVVANRILGEREIIDVIAKRLTTMPNLLVPFGDDVSAIALAGGQVAVLKTDMLVAKTDVPKGMSVWQAARKAVVMNVSDFASKGAVPIAVLVALGLPKDYATEKAVVEIADGLNAGAREYGAYVVGGDTGEASDFIVSISLFGTAKKEALMLRSGARAGDVVAVTGFLGKSAAGLRLLLGGCKASVKERDVLADAVLMPRARLAEGLALGGCGGVSACVDSSDGLAWSLHEIAKMSNVGFLVDCVPVADEAKVFAEANGLDVLELALYGGEEYELVLTVKPEKWDLAKSAVEAVGGCLLRIGKVTTDRQVLLSIDGEVRFIEARGYEHFKTKL